jgi:hypothetical protein
LFFVLGHDLLLVNRELIQHLFTFLRQLKKDYLNYYYQLLRSLAASLTAILVSLHVPQLVFNHCALLYLGCVICAV